MMRFEYVKPASLDEAAAFLAGHPGTARVLAGGTDLMVQIRAGSRRVGGLEYVVDIGGLDELRGIRAEGGEVIVGALTTHSEAAASPLLRTAAPLLACACGKVGGPQTRNLGTVGGNLCNASLSADPVTALVALDAAAHITGPEGARETAVADLLAGNERTNLGAGEILTHLSFRALDPGTACAFVKLGRRKAMSIARLNVAVVLEREGEAVKAARIAVGAAFPTTRRVDSAEALLTGAVPTPELFAAAGAAAGRAMVEATGVRWSTEYKQPVLETLVSRALAQALEG